VSGNFIGVDNDGAFTLKGVYLYLFFGVLFIFLVVLFVSTNDLSERSGFARGYACATDKLKAEQGFILNDVQNPYCDRFHEAFKEQLKIQEGRFE